MSRGDRPLSLDELALYYRGVHFATVAMKGRIARLGGDHRPAVEAINHYQAMVNQYRDALSETREGRAER